MQHCLFQCYPNSLILLDNTDWLLVDIARNEDWRKTSVSLFGFLLLKFFVCLFVYKHFVSFKNYS